jgi:N-acetyl-gamma-glutamylphosphate reductase
VGLQRNQRKGCNLLSRLVGRGYGYKGQEIVEYLGRDPAVITRYLKEGKRLDSEIGKVHEALRKTKKVNKQVPQAISRSLN